jgi:tripartite-type tricarboxylate transporter receptor subunit TctC
MSFGVPVQYLMMRGIFTTRGATSDQVAYYNQLLDRVRALPEWKAFMALGAFRQTTMRGPDFVEWLEKTASFHRVLMREAGLKAGPTVAVPVVASAPPKR